MANDGVFSEALSLYEELKIESELASPNFEKCTNLISRLKILLFQFESFGEGNFDTPNLEQELLLTRQVLEIATLISVKQRDLSLFSCNMNQLKAFYQEFNKHIPETHRSQREHTIVGLELLSLLAGNRRSAFHTEVESLAPELFQNIYVRFPLDLERALMEGNYRKVSSMRADAPSELYLHFFDLVLDSAREEIARCITSSYQTLPAAEAKRLLFLETDGALQSMAEIHHWHLLEGGVLQINQRAAQTQEIPSLSIISQNIEYAKNLERII
eukprot:gnl/Trimastix_PCT/1084.p1 GENE.gnl/Trimastix_PCT/1084~~gnl/Trimastix_PCT/1084.p1  ORF type:complete len:283 (+),score=74.49 gnl/Trimastix_PCT/1084:36-851(+)